MSYAQVGLNLSDVHVACFVGPNGSGKSALLDSITWALWEEARASSDELIRTGQKEMWVELVFEIDKNKYRVKRSRAKLSPKGGGKVISKGGLELQLQNEAGNWQSLTASSSKETQSQINHILRMDYKGFVNSVYLRQGKSNEFTNKLPSQRKQILADILGLQYFDELQELAREKIKSLQNQIDILNYSLEKFDDCKSEYAQSSLAAQKEETKLNELAIKIQQLQKEFFEKRDCATKLKELEDARREFLIQLKDKEHSLAVLRAQAESERVRLTEKITEIKKALKSKRHLLGQQKLFRKLLLKHESLSHKQESYHQLERKSTFLQEKIILRQNELETELSHKREALLDLEKIISQENEVLKIEQELESELRDLEIKEQELILTEDQGLRLKAQIEASANKLVELHNKARDNERKIAELQAHDQDNLCPLCANAIVDLQAVITLYKNENSAIEQEVFQIETRQESWTKDRLYLRQKYQILKSEIEKRHLLDKQIGELNAAREQISKAKDKSQNLELAISKLVMTIKEGSYAQIERQSLLNIESEISRLEFDPVVFAHVQNEIESKRFAEPKILKLLKQEDELKVLEAELAKHEEVIVSTQAELVHEINALILEIESLSLEILNGNNDAMVTINDLDSLEVRLNLLKQEQIICKQELAIAQSSCVRLERELSVLEANRKQLEELRPSLNDYTTLVEALGKNGVQAVLIENALPEIEFEANRVLSKLSDGRLNLALLTQHKTKAGHLNETLELIIGDELGTRAYELYSGGESFKVDFSLRIALSRFLANKAGTKLETLIIDEGFGSQDDLSRDKLIAAIASIQADFARILVITHINEVKEVFPAHIQVDKKDGVSYLV